MGRSRDPSYHYKNPSKEHLKNLQKEDGLPPLAVRDPHCKMKDMRRGIPEENHPRRCQGRIRQADHRNRFGHQCKMYALKGEKFCKFHLPFRHRVRSKLERMTYYSRYAGKALSEKLNELQAIAEKRMTLAEEVDMARILAQRSVKIFERVVLEPPEEKDKRPSPELKAKAIESVKASLDYVANMVVKYAKVQALNEASFSVESVEYILAKVVEIIEKTVMEKDEFMGKTLIDEIRNIKIPDSKAQKTISII